jgi:hypothetical protein
VKLYAIIGGFLYNDVQGVCSEDYIDQVMNDIDENDRAIRFVEITEEEWETYEEWIINRSLPIHREICNRKHYQPRRYSGWRLE